MYILKYVALETKYTNAQVLINFTTNMIWKVEKTGRYHRFDSDSSHPKEGYMLSQKHRVAGLPGGDAAEDGIEVVAAQREENSWGGGPELSGVLMALTVRVDEMTDLWQKLFDQHGFIQTQAVLGLLRREDR